MDEELPTRLKLLLVLAVMVLVAAATYLVLYGEGVDIAEVGLLTAPLLSAVRSGK